jgi:hypothetical protein
MRVGSTWTYVDGSVLVAVPGGEFIMGRGGSDNPVHTVSLGDFWIYRTKVTNQQYQACVAAGQCSVPDLEDNKGYAERTRASEPVNGLNWQQADAYCTYVHGRLPTEAEWEKTARGPDGNIYPWGDAAPSCSLLNFNNCLGKTTNVDLYPQGQSYYEAFDMEGNAFEWVADWYEPLYYKTASVEDPAGPEAGTRRSIRSAGYKASSDQAASAVRFFDTPGVHRRDLGFRCVVEDPTYYAPYCQKVALYGKVPEGTGADGTPLPCDKQVDVDSQAQSCRLGTAYVTFNSNDPTAAIGGVGACTQLTGAPGSFPQVFECGTGGLATIDAFCDFSSLASTAQCDPHYNLDTSTGMCAWDGTGILQQNCPAGFAFDAGRQCCSVQTGEGEDYPVCGATSTLIEDPPGQYRCIASGLVPPPAHDEAPIMLPAACGNPHDSCVERSCNTNGGWGWSPDQCDCVCNSIRYPKGCIPPKYGQ